VGFILDFRERGFSICFFPSLKVNENEDVYDLDKQSTEQTFTNKTRSSRWDFVLNRGIV